MNKKTYATLFLIAFAFVFSSTYNPLNFRRMHVDSSVYMTITQGIIRGQLPYRDFVDNKGPLAYLLSAPGLLLGGFTGVWITELLLICVAVFFAYKTALFFTNIKLIALLGTAFSFAAALSVFTVCAGTEEYSLPFLMVSLYIFTRYYFSPDRSAGFFDLTALGFCFACAVLIRLNMFPLWVGFCVVIFSESIIKCRFVPLGKYILGFCTGILIVSCPVFLYLKSNGILSNFYAQVVVGGAAKGFGDSGGIKHIAKNFFIVINRNFSYIPFLYGVFKIISADKKTGFVYYLGYTFSYLLMVLFLSFSSGDSHYNMVLIPFYIPVVSFFVERVYLELSAWEAKKNIALVLFFCIVFSEGLVKYLDDFTEIFNNDSGKQLILAGKTIDDNTATEDEIISLGMNGYIYPFTQRKAVSRYIYQGSGIDRIPGSREEFLSEILRKKPAIIAIFTGETTGSADYLPVWYAPVFEMIAGDYRLLSDENGYMLYKKQ